MKNSVFVLFISVFFAHWANSQTNCSDSYACNYNPSSIDNTTDCLYPGCTDINAVNFDELAGCDDGSCDFILYGCIDFYACNFNANANINDGSCIYPGCTNAAAINFEPAAGCDDGSCDFRVYGCIDFYACNFNAIANTNDSSCTYPGCIDASAVNFDLTAQCDDGSCFYYFYGCIDSYACNFDSSANLNDGSCIYPGCTELDAVNYDSTAGCDDASCFYYTYGCNDFYACNFNSYANLNDGSCVYPGCTVPAAVNYNVSAGCNDGSCFYYVYGCIDFYACNFESEANINDGSCTYPGCTNFQAVNYDSDAACDDGSCVFEGVSNDCYTSYVFGCTDGSACNYWSAANFNDGSCTYPGCTDPDAHNFNSYAGCDNGICVYFQYGCTDGYACNYTAAANFNDGTCSYPGCTDPEAQNYNSYAGCDNGSCNYFVYGCIDGYACNYNSQANFNDGTCTYPGCTDINAQNYNSYAGCDNGSCNYFVYGCTDGYACNYSIQANFNDGTCNYPGCTDINAQNYNSYAGCDNGSCNYFVYGCTDGYACNYIIQANFNNGTCTYPGCTDVSAQNYNSYAGCDNGSCNYFVYGCTDGYACNYNNQANFNDGSCTYTGCTDPGADNYNSYAGCENGSCFYYSYGCTDGYACNYNNQANFNDGSCTYPGCTDVAAQNYNALAGCSNSSCIYSGCGGNCGYVYGCTDYYTPACNYNALATFNDGSCVYPGCNDPEAINFSAYAGCDNGTCTYRIFGCTDYYTPACNYNQYANFNDGSCVYPGCTDSSALNYNPLAGCDNGICNYFVYGCTDYYTPACNYNQFANFNDGSCVYPGCTDSSALNYNPIAGCDNGICNYFIYGCTDYYTPACNYNPFANFNDGSCVYPGCTDPDAYNYNPIAECDNGICAYFVYGCTDYYSPSCNYDQYSNFNDGSCIYPGCNDPEAYNYNPFAGCDNGICSYFVYGCTDYYTPACNYNANANFNDGSCIYPGCVDSSALNYNPLAGCDNGTCFYFIYGCTDSYTPACNYNPQANFNDGSCTYPGCQDLSATNYNFYAGCPNNSACLYNSDLGCTIAGACNYSPCAITNDGSCTYPGCTSPLASNYNPLAACDDGSCTILGCTDATACNYNPSATIENGSCSFPGCTISAACNYNPDAGCNNGSCLFEACSDPLACNYQPGESCSGGVCVYPGCTSLNACNYNPAAGCSDESCVFPQCGDVNACNYVLNALCYNNGYCDYPALYYNCNGACLNDTDGDGICDPFEIVGCTDVTACNYNSQASVSDNSCVYPGCTSLNACNYNPAAGCSDESCVFPQCGDVNACNYVLNALCYNNGYCAYPTLYYSCNGACLNDTDGDGICDPFEIVGCTDVTACNYNSAAEFSNGSCTYPGCTTPGACNYNPAAGCSNDTCLYLDPCGVCGGLCNVTTVPDGNVSICEGGEIIIQAYPSAAVYNYVWYNNGVLIQEGNSSYLAVGDAGNYYVVVSFNGESQASDMISVSSGVVASISVNSETALPACVNSEVILTATTSGGTVLWSNGAVGNSIAVNSPGNYYATLTSDAGCQINSNNIEITYTSPVNDFSASTNTLFLPENQVSFTVDVPNPQGLSYEWIFGNQETSLLANPTTNYDQPGFYDVSLTVTDPLGCSATISRSDYIQVWNVFPSDDVALPDDYDISSSTWTSPYAGCVSLVNGNTGGNGYGICITYNGGQTWVPSAINDTRPVYNVRQVGNASWLSGGQGLLCVSYNGGQSWQPVELANDSSDFNSLQFSPDGSTGWLAGTNGYICLYNNGTWNDYSGIPSNYSFNSIYGGNGWGYAVGNSGNGNGVICRYTSGSWVASEGIFPELNSTAFWNSQSGVAVGANSTILSTNDGGFTWTTLSSGIAPYSLNNVYVIDPQRWICVGDNGLVLTTDDGGQNFEIWNIGVTVDLSETNASDCKVYITGKGGRVFTYDTPFEVQAPLIVQQGDSQICEGEVVNLYVANPKPDEVYIWSNGLTGNAITVDTPGDYTVYSTGYCGTSNPSNPKTISQSDNCPDSLTCNIVASQNSVCLQGEVQLSLENILADTTANITWSNSSGVIESNADSIILSLTQTTTFNVQIEVGSETCISSVTIEVQGSGCTAPNACNYDVNACVNDGSCVYPGCNNQQACNYNSLAGCNNGSCIFPSSYLNCDGQCINDADSDGICDELELAGCSDSLACNYVQGDTDTTDDFCIYPGCTNPYACNYSQSAGCNDGSCIPSGCMNPSADNYNPLAECETYCIISGCTDPLADNYISSANIDNGSCYYSPSILVYFDSIPGNGFDEDSERGLPNKPVRVTINPAGENREIVVYTDGEGYIKYPFSNTDELELKLLLQEESWVGDTVVYTYNMNSGEDRRLAMTTVDSIVNFKPRIINTLVSDIDSLKGYGGGMYVYNNRAYPVKARLVLRYDSLEWDESFTGDAGNIESMAPDSVDTANRRVVWHNVEVPAGEMKLLSFKMTGDTVDGYNNAIGTYNFNYRMEMLDVNDNPLFTKDSTLQLKVRDAYSPNDITADPVGYEVPHYIAAGDEIVYTIRFENTSGFEAKRVLISDTVDTYSVDFNTIRPLGNSHRSITNAVVEKISDSQAVISFDFKGINLSSSDTVDTYSKIGYAMFAVKTYDTLSAGSVIYNKAQIMFEDSLGNQFYEEETDSIYHTIYDCSMMQQIRQDTSYCEGYDLILETDTTFAYEWSWTDNGDTLSFSDSLQYNGLPGEHLILLMRANPICTRYDSLLIDIYPNGCTDPNACNFDTQAICDDGSCGAIIGSVCNDGDSTTVEDVIQQGCICEGEIVTNSGCMDSLACNYDSSATVSVGCEYPMLYLSCSGECLNDSDSDGVCEEYELLGCLDSLACNYTPADTNLSDNLCIYPGCTDYAACNYVDSVACDDGSCTYPGCTNPNACNYEVIAGCDDGSCLNAGCINTQACNFDSNASCNDGSCILIGDECNDGNINTINDIINENCNCEGTLLLLGCTDSLACNYNPAADIDDGNCSDTLGTACDDQDTLTFNDVIVLGCECLGTLSLDYTESEHFYLYPNPVSDDLNIYIGRSNNALIEVYNMQGDCVHRANYQAVLNVSSYSSGTYFMRIYRDGKVETVRFEVVR